jgi:hypothetical protein
MIAWIFVRLGLELWNVGRQLGRHRRLTQIMTDGSFNKLVNSDKCRVSRNGNLGC